jgi:hypothetical protein
LDAAPRRRAHEEAHLLLGQVDKVGPPASLLERMGLHALTVYEQLHLFGCRPGIEALADVAIGHRVQAPPDLHVRVGANLGARPGGKLVGHCRQRQEDSGLLGDEDLEGSAPLECSWGPPPCHLFGPPPRVSDHRLQARELTPGEEALADEALHRFDESLGIHRQLLVRAAISNGSA